MKPRIADLFAALVRIYCELPKESPSEWACKNLRFNEPNNRGPFTLLGREYNREPIDTIADPIITDLVMVYGSQSGKTASIMAMIAWIVRFVASRILWVMPNTDGTGGAKNFSSTRWQPMLLASAVFNALIPTGRRRHEFKNLQQRVNGAIIDFVGSNSPANLASNPCRVQVLDEVDKFNEGTEKEGDAVGLAEQRGKNFGSPKRIKTSTPTVVSALIWQEFLKGDQRRYFVPCVHCGKHVVFAWSAAYALLRKTGCEAYVFWDKDAKKDGKWDLDAVKRSAHAQCPHCQGKLTDGDKTKMMRKGEWRATNPYAPRHFRSYHLPSLYASSPQTSFGSLAVKFLQAKSSLLGLQGFINGDLAEPYQSQDRQAERVELISSRIEITAEWNNLLTSDCQAKNTDGGYFPFVKRAWSERESVTIAAGFADTWDELRSLQQSGSRGWHVAGAPIEQGDIAIVDAAVMVDSGFGARSDSDVYINCASHGEFMPRPHPKKPLFVGWMPAKGFPARKRWIEPETKLLVPYCSRTIDPYLGHAEAGRVEMSYFEFSGDYFKDVLDGLRRDTAGKCGHKWSVDEAVATEEYWRHMDAEIKTGVQNKSSGKVTYLWQPRSAHWPNHLYDCEVMQIAFASFLTIFKLPDLG